MFTITESSAGSYVEVQLSGKLTKEAYEAFIPELESVIAEHGKIRLLVEMKDFHGWDLAAVWEDTKFGYKHYSDIERIAIVGETTWEKWMTGFCKPFTRAKIKYFDTTELEVGRAWAHQEHIPLHHQLLTESGVLILHPDDKLTKEDFDTVATEIDPYIEKNGKLNGVLIDASHFDGWKSFSDMIAHFKFVSDHHRNIKRVAIVSDEDTKSRMPTFMEHFVSAEVLHFRLDEKAKALDWLTPEA